MARGLRVKLEKKNEIVYEICKKYSNGDVTIDSCCESEGVAYDTFSTWCSKEPIYRELYNKAQESKINAFKRKLCQMAVTSLEKRIKGYDYDEVEKEEKPDVNGTFNVCKVKTTRKHLPPDPVLTRYAINNTLNPYFKDKIEQETVHSGEVLISKRLLDD